MLDIQNLSFRYPKQQVFTDLNLRFNEPGIHLIAGPTGIGKSTLLEIIAGSTPLFKGGDLLGSIWMKDVNLFHISQSERVRTVGFVGSDPSAMFVSQIVFDEIAFALRFLNLERPEITLRVKEIARTFKIEELLYREIDSLSAGQKQRVAIASVLVVGPALLLLDEPTSALDPIMSNELLELVQNYSRANNIYTLMSEHRTDRVLEFATSVTLLDRAATFTPAESLRFLSSPSVFPILQEFFNIETCYSVNSFRDSLRDLPQQQLLSKEESLGNAHDIVVTNACIDVDTNPVLHDINLSFARGSITALIGENGAGKTTLIHSVLGDYCPSKGSIALDGKETSTLRGVNLLKSFGIVPSNPQDLFLCHSVSQECALADQDRNLIIGTTLNTFKELAPTVSLDTHPRDLSSGQQLSLALAIALASQPEVLLLDEPTRGLDGKTKALLIERLLQCKALGACIILATHDMELVAQLADRVLVMKSGTISAEGTPQEILCSTTGFQTLTGEIFAPLPLLTVDDVRLAYQHA